MTHQEYREYVISKCGTPEECSLMGLVGETGEIIDYLKKVKHHGHTLDRKKLGNEFGDLLWYFVDVARRHEVYVENLLPHYRVVGECLPALAKMAAAVYEEGGTNKVTFRQFFGEFMDLITERGFTLEEIMDLNKEKLDARYKAKFTPAESQKRADVAQPAACTAHNETKPCALCRKAGIG